MPASFLPESYESHTLPLAAAPYILTQNDILKTLQQSLSLLLRFTAPLPRGWWRWCLGASVLVLKAANETHVLSGVNITLVVIGDVTLCMHAGKIKPAMFVPQCILKRPMISRDVLFYHFPVLNAI